MRGAAQRVASVAWALAAALLLAPQGARAGGEEPGYCDPAAFAGHAIDGEVVDRRGLVRLRAFRLGRVVLAGLAVGSSDVEAVRALSLRFSAAPPGDGFCTWYVNSGSPQAARTFNHRYVPNPASLDERSGPARYLEELGPAFDQGAESFLSCAAEHGFVALGCDGMMHRGPTVFGMLLAYSGCAPEHAAEIVNALWGLNGVEPGVRLAIIRAAHELGAAHPVERERLAELLSK